MGQRGKGAGGRKESCQNFRLIGYLVLEIFLMQKYEFSLIQVQYSHIRC